MMWCSCVHMFPPSRSHSCCDRKDNIPSYLIPCDWRINMCLLSNQFTYNKYDWDLHEIITIPGQKGSCVINIPTERQLKLWWIHFSCAIPNIIFSARILTRAARVVPLKLSATCHSWSRLFEVCILEIGGDSGGHCKTVSTFPAFNPSFLPSFILYTSQSLLDAQGREEGG